MKRPRLSKQWRTNGRKQRPTSPEQDALACASLFVVMYIESWREIDEHCTGHQAADGSGKLPNGPVELAVMNEITGAYAARVLERAERLGLTREQLEAGEAFVQRMPVRKIREDYPKALRVIGGRLSP